MYENFFRNEEEDYNNDGKKDGTIRVFAKTKDINLACMLQGSFPQKADEIAIDRMHADNVGIKVGDTVTVSGETYKVVGLLAYVNYSTLHEKTTDLMFDALKFDVAMVTQDGFDRLHKSIHYTYAWKYEMEPADEAGEKTSSDNFMRALLTQVVVADNELEDYTPKYGNPAINFATDDMGSDKAMGGVLLDILVVIIAFIFAVTISNTIAKESSAIGTLRASGYTKGELVRHYLSMPVIVTLLAAIVGNILGYTVFKNIVVSMYYNSYSLPTYYTIWNPDAFFKTTVVPVILMLVVNLIVIVRMMQHTPLQFLRHDLKKTKNKKVGVIGTSATINSHSYRNLLKEFDSEIETFEQDCPLFVPLVENGFIDKDDEVVRLVIERYMTDIKNAGVDTVILGCTHYPIIKDAISSVMGEGVELIDSGKETAIYAAKILKENNLLSDRKENGDCEFYVSDAPDGFENIANVFLGENVSHKVEQINIELY